MKLRKQLIEEAERVTIGWPAEKKEEYLTELLRLNEHVEDFNIIHRPAMDYLPKSKMYT